MTNSTAKLNHPAMNAVTEQEPVAWNQGLHANDSARLGIGRVLCIGGQVAKEVNQQLGEAQYQTGHLDLSSDIEELICKATSFVPDLVYLALDGELQAALDVLEAFSKDHRTKDIPLLSLLPAQANSSLIQEAYSRTACDFFRLDHTRVELLARTHLLVRLAHSSSSNASEGQVSNPLAANQPAAGRVDLRDESTNLFSVSYFFHRLPTEVSRARRYKRALSLIALRCPAAVDNDEVSERLSKTLQKHLRDSDIPARLEPDLFVCLLPEITSDKLAGLEQRLARDFERASLDIKIGHAGLDGEDAGCSPQDLVERARAGTQSL